MITKTLVIILAIVFILLVLAFFFLDNKRIEKEIGKWAKAHKAAEQMKSGIAEDIKKTAEQFKKN